MKYFVKSRQMSFHYVNCDGFFVTNDPLPVKGEVFHADYADQDEAMLKCLELSKQEYERMAIIIKKHQSDRWAVQCESLDDHYTKYVVVKHNDCAICDGMTKEDAEREAQERNKQIILDEIKTLEDLYGIEIVWRYKK